MIYKKKTHTLTFKQTNCAQSAKMKKKCAQTKKKHIVQEESIAIIVACWIVDRDYIFHSWLKVGSSRTKL